MGKRLDEYLANIRKTWSAGSLATMAPALRHLACSILLIGLYILLNQPGVILLTKLGFTLWFPATGLVLAAMLSLSPRYFPAAILADALAGRLIYHQPFLSWGETVGAVASGGSYAIAAYLLRGRLKIDPQLRHRRDVVRYLLVVMLAAAVSTLVGVACLVKDHSISESQYWASAADWYVGDAVALLGFAPFLLIHIFPRVENFVLRSARQAPPTHASGPAEPGIQWALLVEELAQFGSIVLVLWVMFGRTLGPKALYYLSFLPVIWIAMRQGIQRVASALLLFDFGVVLALYVFPAPPDFRPKVALLMLAVSATGLLVGSEVTERHRIAEQLQTRTEFLDSLIKHNPLAIVIQDSRGLVQLCNEAFLRLFQYGSQEILGQRLDLQVNATPNLAVDPTQPSGTPLPGQFVRSLVQARRKDGAVLDLELHVVSIGLESGLSGTYLICKDISEQLKAARDAQDHAESLNGLITELQLRATQMTLLSEMSDLLQCCGTMPEAFGVITQSLRKLFSASTAGAVFLFEDSRESAEAKVVWGRQPVTESALAPGECWALRRGGSHWSENPGDTVICHHLKNPVPASYLCLPMVAQGETLGVLHVQYNRSESARGTEAFESLQESQKRLAIAVSGHIALSLASLQLRETLREQSLRDPLTGLFNRRFLQESLGRELLRARRKNHPLTVAILDLDHFKRFNDIHGHEAGDTVLRSIAEQLLAHFRGDDVVCRYGGEEFALVLPEATALQAANRAEQFRVSVGKLKVPFQGAMLGGMSVSIGIASFPEHAQTLEELLRTADACLYLSKSDGRDRVTIASRKEGPSA